MTMMNQCVRTGCFGLHPWDRFCAILLGIALFFSAALVSRDANAQQSETQILLAGSFETSWAYFQDPTTQYWFIADRSGTVYGLATNHLGHSAWMSLGRGSSIATVDFANQKVSIAANAAAITPTDSFLSVSLVRSEGSFSESGDAANRWAKLIQGKTFNMAWLFFQVSVTQSWYIVLADPIDPARVIQEAA